MDLSGQFDKNDTGPSIASMREATAAKNVASSEARSAREAKSTAQYNRRRSEKTVQTDPTTGGATQGGQPLVYGPNRSTLQTIRNREGGATGPSSRLMGDTLSAVTGRKEGAVASDETSELYTSEQRKSMLSNPKSGSDVTDSPGYVKRPDLVKEQGIKRANERSQGEARAPLPAPSGTTRPALRGEGLSRAALAAPTPSSGQRWNQAPVENTDPTITREKKQVRRGEAYGPAVPIEGDSYAETPKRGIPTLNVFSPNAGEGARGVPIMGRDGNPTGWRRHAVDYSPEGRGSAGITEATQRVPSTVPIEGYEGGRRKSAPEIDAEYKARSGAGQSFLSGSSGKVNSAQAGQASGDPAPRTPTRGADITTGIPEGRAAQTVAALTQQVQKHSDAKRLTESEADAVATRKFMVGDPSEAVDPADIPTAGDIAKVRGDETEFRKYTVSKIEPRLILPQSQLGAGMVTLPTGKMRKMEGDPGGVRGKTFAHDLYAKVLEGTKSRDKTLTPKQVTAAQQPAQGGGRSITEAGKRALQGDGELPKGLHRHGMKVLQHISEHRDITGDMPSYQMIAEAMDLGSSGNARRVIQSLVNKGLMGSTEARGTVTSPTDDEATRKTVGSSTAGPRTKQEPIKNKTAPDLLPKGMGSQFDASAAERVRARREAKRDIGRFVDDTIDTSYDDKPAKADKRVIRSQKTKAQLAEIPDETTPADKKADRKKARDQRLADGAAQDKK